MSESPPSPADEVSGFVAKWRGAWPEWALVEGFLPAGERARVDAWHALQFELQEAAWRSADARPGEAKLGWWMEELDGWSQGRRRHPLGAVLQRQAAPWQALATALPSLALTRERAADAQAASSALAPVASAVADVEAALFGAERGVDAVDASWQHARLARHVASAVPRAYGDDAGAWARALLARWPSARGLARSRRLVLALAKARLARGDAAAPLPPWSAVWAGWRGARG